ncbi:beta-1,4-glucuronyltransferase 1 [Drosophila sechellia]|uniref:GM25976 n=1 Tax=Drosophila sechellia TaxID=7238 RepID=B4IEC6_DROSE|nr:beta-1,4-glucuronyltransferase 1 [Drosophila sechellia]EDW45953.1 GM25976 [Drosophila sechellia]
MFRLFGLLISLIVLSFVLGISCLEKGTLAKLKKFVNCESKAYKSSHAIYKDYWVLENYVMAEHGDIPCYSNVTYTTHADYTYLDNVVPLLERWRSPLSLAIYAPGTDFEPTIQSILYLLQCHPGHDLVRQLCSIHLYFDVEHLPQVVLPPETALKEPANCNGPPPYVNVFKGNMYRAQNTLDYPVNMGRNIARRASLTHYVLASDIELYPTPGLVSDYLHFLGRQVIGIPGQQPTSPLVHVLRIFEVMSNVSVPNTKPELQEMLKSGEAVPFHMDICEACHRGPNLEEWINASVVSQELNVFNVGHRSENNNNWEPIFVGTVEDPPYDERLTWEGQRDKMTQAYAMCVLDYEFHILDNAFLVHKPGIKQPGNRKEIFPQERRNNGLINKKISREMRMTYGTRSGCVI